MPPRSPAHALERLREDNPQLADHVHLGTGQLDMFPKLAMKERRKDHDWNFVGLDVLAETLGRFQCSRCGHWMTRRGESGEVSIEYYSPDGTIKLAKRPECSELADSLETMPEANHAQ